MNYLKEKKMLNLFYTFMRRFCLYFGGAMIICGMLPIVTHGIWKSEGIWALLLGGIFLLLLHRESLCKKIFGKHWKWMEGAVYGLLCAGIVFALILTIMIVWYAFFHFPPKDAETTLVVLGCKINGNNPTVMLRQRLDSAYRALEKNPSLNCVVSGGQGPDEQFSESHIMREYLIGKGIAPERIREENRSTNTRENLIFSRQVIAENGWPETITIVTSGYHQCRAGLMAKRLDMKFYNQYAPTSFYLVPAYVVREYLGIVHLWLFGE